MEIFVGKVAGDDEYEYKQDYLKRVILGAGPEIHLCFTSCLCFSRWVCNLLIVARLLLSSKYTTDAYAKPAFRQDGFVRSMCMNFFELICCVG